MYRALTIVGATLIGCLSGVSISTAQPPETVRFVLQPTSGNKLELNLQSGSDSLNGKIGSTFRPADLEGLRPDWSNGGPVQFALTREAGQLYCAGMARSRMAEGTCRVTRDQVFAEMLINAGVGRPSDKEALGLIVVGAQRDLLHALQAARYPAPNVQRYIALTAVGVTRAYITDLTGSGYRPDNTQRLVEFRALEVSPGYLTDLSSAGYPNLSDDQVVQLAALKIDAAFIRSFQRIGYRDIPVNKLIELKGVGVTPQFVESARGGGRDIPSLDKLIQLKALGLVTARSVR